MISHSLCSLKVGSTTQHSQQNVPGASSWPKSPVANLQPRTKHLSGKGRKCWQSQPTSGAGSLGGGAGAGRSSHANLMTGPQGEAMIPQRKFEGTLPTGEGLGAEQQTAALPNSSPISLCRSGAWNSILTNSTRDSCYFQRALSRHNLHTVNFIHLKCTSHWVLGYSQPCAISTVI